MNPRRRQGLTLAAGLLLGGLTAPGAARAQASMVRLARGDLVAADVGAILARGHLVVAMAATDSPPFFYTQGGQLKGTDVRMAEQLADELKVTLRIDRSPASFNQVVDSVARGDADLGISKLSHTLPRALSVHFSSPYLVLSHALILNRAEFAKLLRDRPLSWAIRNFTGALAVIANSAFSDFAPRYFPLARIVPYPSWEAAVEAVRRGQVTGAYRDEFEVRRLIKADPGLALTLRAVTLKDLSDHLAIAVGVRNPTLLAFVNKFVDQRVEKVTVDTLLDELS
jgi:ABC-type amino acid transport substrate-binding protein